MGKGDRYSLGIQTRGRILGDDYSPKRNLEEGAFAEFFDKLSAEVVWADIWSRGELLVNIRSLVTLAFLMALDRPDQLRLHIKGALKTGNSRAEIEEVFLHGAIYCGFPAASAGLKIAHEVFKELNVK